MSLVAIIGIIIAAGAVNGQEMCRPNSPRTDCGTRVLLCVHVVDLAWPVKQFSKPLIHGQLQQALIDMKRFAKLANYIATRASE